MTNRTVDGVDGLRELVGVDLEPSPWIAMSQERIAAFAECTEDRQWIHLDAERAATESPFGGTVAHGFLTLSLIVAMWESSATVDGFRLKVNYGLNRVRFPAPVPTGSRIRGRFRIEELEDVSGGVQARTSCTMEREGGNKPVCVAEILLRFYP